MTRREDAYGELLPTGPMLPTISDVQAYAETTTAEEREESPGILGTWRASADRKRIEGHNDTWRILGSDLEADAIPSDAGIEMVKFTCAGSKKSPHETVYVGEAWRFGEVQPWYLHEYHGRTVQIRPDGGVRAQSEGKADFLLDRLNAVETEEMAAAEAAERAAQESGEEEGVQAAATRWQRANQARTAQLIAEGKLPTADDHVVVIFNCPECSLDLRVSERSMWREKLTRFLDGAAAAGIELGVEGEGEWLRAVPVRILEYPI